MPLSFQQHTANGSTTVFDASQIDGYLSVNDIYVFVNDVQKTAGVHYSLQTSPSLQVTFLSGNTPAFKDEVRIQRLTPNTVSGRAVDFADGSVLNANDLDQSALQLLYITQEAEDLGSGALGKNFDQLGWNAEGLPITDAVTGGGSDSLATKGYVDNLALYGGGAINPQAWTFSGDSVQDTFTLSPVANATNPAMFIVEVDGVLLRPTTDYTIPATSQILFATPPSTATNNIRVRNMGVSRNLNESVSTAMLQNDAVTTAKILNANVTAAKLADLSVTTAKLADLSVTTAKIADLNVTTGKIADLGVTTGKLDDLGVTTGKLANGAVTSAKLDTNIAISGQLTVGSVGQSLINSSTATLSGSSTVISGIPSWAKRVTISITALSTTGTNVLLTQVGHSGSLQTSGYAGMGSDYASSNVSTGQFTWGPATSFVAAGSYSGRFVLERIGTTNTWSGSGNIVNTSSGKFHLCVGTVIVGGALDRVALLTASPQTFDAGTMCVAWE